jgi:hypothetical protein
MFYTYAHYTPAGRLFYIGKGQRKRAWDKKRRNNYWQNIVSKHGDPVEWKTEKEAFDHEKFLILCFKEMQFKLANMTDGGDGASGVVVSNETRIKMSIANSSRKRTKEECKNISLGLLGKPRPNGRKPKTEEHKARISAALTGRKRIAFSEEWRATMSAALKKSHAERKKLKGN